MLDGYLFAFKWGDPVKMIKTSCGYMTAKEWAMICRVSKQEEHQKKKVEKNSDRRGHHYQSDYGREMFQEFRKVSEL